MTILILKLLLIPKNLIIFLTTNSMLTGKIRLLKVTIKNLFISLLIKKIDYINDKFFNSVEFHTIVNSVGRCLQLKYVRQLNGGFKTDFDYPFIKDKYFKKKFGSGDLRLLFKKI
jgi:hypothetical protein